MHTSDISAVETIHWDLFGDQIPKPGAVVQVENSPRVRIWCLIENLQTLLLQRIGTRCLRKNSPKFTEVQLLSQDQTGRKFLNRKVTVLGSSILTIANRKCVGVKSGQKRFHKAIDRFWKNISIIRGDSSTNKSIQKAKTVQLESDKMSESTYPNKDSCEASFRSGKSSEIYSFREYTASWCL